MAALPFLLTLLWWCSLPALHNEQGQNTIIAITHSEMTPSTIQEKQL